MASPDDADDTDNPDDTEEKDPVEEIFAIIERYYEGLKREDEGMGVD